MHSHRTASNEHAELEISISAAQDGSFAALGQLLDYYRDYLWRVANEELARDLMPKCSPSDAVQDTFLQAAMVFDQFRGRTEAELRAWLRRILLNNIRDAAKRYQAQRRDRNREVSLDHEGNGVAAAFELPTSQPSPSEICRTTESLEALRGALTKLCDSDREVIELRSIRGMPFDEIGEQLGKSTDAARKQWARAIERLARIVGRGESP